MTDRITRMPNPVTLAEEMQGIVRLAAWPARPGELVTGQINRAARLLGLSARRTETMWYGRASHVLAQEADALRAWRDAWRASRRERLARELAALDGKQEQLWLDLLTEEGRDIA